MDSDSDDDLLLAAPVFCRPSRKDAKRKRDVEDILASALAASEDHLLYTQRLKYLQTTVGNGIDDGEQMERAKLISASAKNKPTHSTQEITDGAEDYVKDVDVFDKEKQKRLARAFDAERSLCLGLRPTICFQPKRASNVHFYESEDEAMADLANVLVEIEKAGTEGESLASSLRGALPDCLADKLLHGVFVGKLRKIGPEAKAPPLVAKWLFQTAVSANNTNMLATGATKCLVDLLSEGRLTYTCLDSYCAQSLVAWCDIHAWPQHQDSSEEKPERVGLNLVGLDNLLTVWELVVRAGSNPPELSNDMTTALKALVFIGIDPMVVSPTFSISLQADIRRFLHTFLGKVDATSDKADSMQSFTQNLAEEILAPLVNEISATTDSKDEINAAFPALCRVALLRGTPGEKIPRLSLLLHHELATKSLQAMGVPTDTDVSWSGECLGPPLRVAFLRVLAAVQWMTDWGDEILVQSSTALAISDCGTQAIAAGFGMLDSAYSKGQEGAIAQILHRLCLEVTTLLRRIPGKTSNDNIQRMDYLWDLYLQFFNELYSSVADESTGMESPRIQTSLNSFLRNKPSPDSVQSPM